MTQASISLLLKKNKDPLLCESYRPVSLLCCDYKILTKVLAGRLEKIMPKLINPDQTGFIAGRQLSSNLRREFNIIYQPNNVETELILSLDAQKAFDRIVWQPQVVVCVVCMGVCGAPLALLSLPLPQDYSWASGVRAEGGRGHARKSRMENAVSRSLSFHSWPGVPQLPRCVCPLGFNAKTTPTYPSMHPHSPLISSITDWWSTNKYDHCRHLPLSAFCLSGKGASPDKY